jgi:hypothetical protein
MKVDAFPATLAAGPVPGSFPRTWPLTWPPRPAQAELTRGLARIGGPWQLPLRTAIWPS